MPNTLRLLTDKLATPIGELVVIFDEEGRLRATDWTNYDERMQRLLARHYGEENFTLTPAHNPSGLASAIAGICFDGDLHVIDSLPVAMEGTAFQKRVWQALRFIPAGQTISYGELAVRLQDWLQGVERARNRERMPLEEVRAVLCSSRVRLATHGRTSLWFGSGLMTGSHWGAA